MIVTIDGQRVEHDFPAGLTLQDVIDQARAGGTPDRLVVGVCVDGQDCDEQRLAELLVAPVDATTQIDRSRWRRWADGRRRSRPGCAAGTWWDRSRGSASS